MASERLKLIKARLQVKLRAAQRKAAQELAKAIPEVIKIRTRLEEQDRNNKNLKPLSQSYKDFRAGKVAFFTKGSGPDRRVVPYKPSSAPDLHPDTSPETSNLTATGQMLDAIAGKSSGTKVTVEVKNNRRRRELNGSRSKLTNKEVQRYVEADGREFLELSQVERKEAEQLVVDIIKEELSDIIK